MVFYLLPITESVTLKSEFKAENIVVFQSAKLDLGPNTGTGYDNTYVEINSADGDVLLTVAIRRAANDIVLNSKPADAPLGY